MSTFSLGCVHHMLARDKVTGLNELMVVCLENLTSTTTAGMFLENQKGQIGASKNRLGGRIN